MLSFTPDQQRLRRETPLFNVRDHLRGMDIDGVKEQLAKTQQDVIIVFQSSIRDFNLASAIRNCNAFNIKEFWIAGLRLADTRGAVGAQHYLNHRRFHDTQDALDELRTMDYTCVAVEQALDSMSSFCYDWRDDKVALFFGEEGTDLDPEIVRQCDFCLEIPMFGSVRSLNLATSAGIVLYDMQLKRNRSI